MYSPSRTILAVAVLAGWFAQVLPAQQVITTLAGKEFVYPRAPTAALDAPLGPVDDVAWGAQGRLYIADSRNRLVLLLSPSGMVSIFAGNGFAISSGDGGPAIAAGLREPAGLAVGADGSVYVADEADHRIRRIRPNGVIEAFAGSGRAGFAGDGGRAALARLNQPRQLAFDTLSNLYVVETAGNRIRRIDRNGLISTAIEAVAPTAVTVDLEGRVWFADAGGLKRFHPDAPTTVETVAPRLNVAGLAVDPRGVVTWSTGEGHQVFNLNGVIAGNGFPGSSGDGEPARGGRLSNPLGIAYSLDGRLAIADSGNGLVRQVDPDLTLSRLAGSRGFRFTGDGGLAPLATLNSPQGVSLAPSGRVLIADTNSNRIRAIEPDGVIDSLHSGETESDSIDPRGLSGPSNVLESEFGDVFVADRRNLRIARLTQDLPETIAGGGFVRNVDNILATEARLLDPTDLVFDMAGNLLLTDRQEHRVRRVGSDGRITTFAGSGAQGGAGDNGPASRASLNGPRGLAVGLGGEVYITDEGNNRVRVVTPDGTIRRFAGRGPAGFAGDGQNAIEAQLHAPTGVAVGPDGSLYIADSGNNRIRRVGPNQVIETVAGNGLAAFSGDGGPALQAALHNPTGLAVDPFGNLLVADEGNDRVRVVLARAPQFVLFSPGDIGGGSVESVDLQTVVGEDSPTKIVALDSEIDGLRFEVSVAPVAGSSNDVGWLEVSPLQGAMPTSLRLVGKGVSEGLLQAQVRVRVVGAGADEFVTLNVAMHVISPDSPTCPSNCTEPILGVELDRVNLVFGAYQGGATESAILEPKLTLFRPAVDSVAAAAEEGAAVAQRAETVLFARADTDDGAGWLTVSPGSNRTVDGVPPPFEIFASPLGLAVGTYTGSVEVGGDGVESAVLPVTMTVAVARPKLELDRTGLTFRAAARGPRPLDRGVAVKNAGTGGMAWTATAETLSGGPWLTVSPRGGQVVGGTGDFSDLRVTVNPAGLAPGNYFGSIEITAPGTTPQSVTVIFNVTPTDEPLPPEVSTSGLVFTAAGEQSPGSRDVTFRNLNARPVTYIALLQGSDSSERLLLAPTRGMLGPGEQETIRVQPIFDTTPIGVARERLTVAFSVGGSTDVEITTVKAAGGAALSAEGGAVEQAGCATSSLQVTPTAGGAVIRHPRGQPMDLEALVVDNCGRPLTSSSPSAKVRFSAPGSSVDLQHRNDGVWTGSFQPVAAVGEIRASYTAFLGFLPAQADVTIEIIDGAIVPLVSEGGLVNAASFERAPQISPGSLISLFGESLAEGSAAATVAPLPELLAGSQVKLGDRPLKLFFAGGNQINAQIPFDIEPNLQHRIEIRRGAAVSVPEQVTVAPTQPGIFAVNQAGAGQGAITDASTGVVSDAQAPARIGDALSAYCTGLGAVNPPAPEGQQAPVDPLSHTVNPVSVTVDGRPAQVLFSGLAPGFAGLYQVNFVVPEGTAPGTAVPVTLTVGGKTSPPVTIAVE